MTNTTTLSPSPTRLTLNRPQFRNALSMKLLQSLSSAIDHINEDSSVRSNVAASEIDEVAVMPHEIVLLRPHYLPGSF